MEYVVLTMNHYINMNLLESYVTNSNETIELLKNYGDNEYAVACWDEKGESRWYVEFKCELSAREEFVRWRFNERKQL